ncbi:hypothetical protein ACNKHS_19080 [Shigella flexneri]
MVDCANGATYHIAPNVFRELGAKSDHDWLRAGRPERRPKIGATDVRALQARVLAEKPNLGIA